MVDREAKYFMTISLNVLKHLGLNLYSNTPAVLSEVIANSWDADAKNVDVTFDLEGNTVEILDDGCGMDLADINKKYLYVGYEKRKRTNGQQETCLTEVLKRRPMGRKGIGKLSLFSIADKIQIHTRKKGTDAEAFELDAEKLQEAIKNEDPFNAGSYEPASLIPDLQSLEPQGTCIRITKLKRITLNQRSVNALRKRLARRFSILGDEFSFTVKVDGKPLSLSERDYFHKVRFLYQYGGDYSNLCSNIDTLESDAGQQKCAFERSNKFNSEGVSDDDGKYQVTGWIAIAARSNDLDGEGGDDTENLNRITITSRGKVAQEDILQEFRMGGMITKYMFGEIEATFLDDDFLPDIATSSRQRFSEEDDRYQALKKFIGNELNAIWKHTNKLKEKTSIQFTLSTNPHIKKWYEGLKLNRLKTLANKIFTDIDRAGIEETERHQAYANGVLLFEHLKLNHVANLIEGIDITAISEFLNYLHEVDLLESALYQQIVTERLNIIKKLQSEVEANALEKVLQEYLFDHLFLLDPSWERSTADGDMEKTMERVFQKGKLRADITYTKYRRVAAAHVIVELKRSEVIVSKTELESQIKGYMRALESELQLRSQDRRKLPIEGVCVVGKLPVGWEIQKDRLADEESLRMLSIRVVTYKELIDNAFAAYSRFIQANELNNELSNLITEIAKFGPDSTS